MINRLAIEGIDGSGKSTTCQELVKQLEADGLRVKVFAPYRLANARLGHDIYDLWQNAGEQATKLMKKVVADCEAEAAAEQADVVIYDRHWMTGMESMQSCAEGSDYWEKNGPEFVPVALLRVPIETALERRADELDDPWMQGEGLGRTAECYHNLARRYGQHLLGIYRSDNDVTPDQVASNIIWDMRVRR
jgi:thymidylate kinase